MLHIRGMHFNEKYWPKPQEFIPERFLVIVHLIDRVFVIVEMTC